MSSCYAYFYDAVHNVEMVYEYCSREAMLADFDMLNYICAKYGTQDYTVYEIDKATAERLIEQAPDKTMFPVNNAKGWYVGMFRY